MIHRIATITIEIGTVSPKATVPAPSRVNIEASVAYATEDSMSLEKTASALSLESRSSPSSSLARARPKTRRRTPVVSFSPRRTGAIASRLAVTVPGPS